ncbi:amino acid ABC transporter permease [uncultured Microbacterium sp.]|uniref:amino acid ABC transporter permease n=1 Tax=uncultured Microbacterium sp. TaxID=191216 RepID=UPI0028DB868E|nr:amino acid ABC transporter permease [uncultured Microbacterium sp.]
MESPWQLFLESLGPIALAGLTATVPLALASFVLGLFLAIVVALMRISVNPVLSSIARFYISVIRGTPMLVQLFVIFYGLPSIGVTLDPWPSAIIALSMNVGGYGAEVVRAAILSVPKGQWEAAYTVGMNRTRTLTRIILPQAARVSVPPLSNTFIALVKDTSLASLILVTELFKVAQQIASTTLEFMVLYLAAALVYWVLCLILSFGQSALERRLDSRVAH